MEITIYMNSPSIFQQIYPEKKNPKPKIMMRLDEVYSIRTLYIYRTVFIYIRHVPSDKDCGTDREAFSKNRSHLCQCAEGNRTWNFSRYKYIYLD